MTYVGWVRITVAALQAVAVHRVAAQATAPRCACLSERPRPYPVTESPGFANAVDRGTRTRTGNPGPRYWNQRATYQIEASLDPRSKQLTGHETVRYTNFSPDTLARLAIYVRQNIFRPGAPHDIALPVTSGMQLRRVTIDGLAVGPTDSADERKPGYHVDGTVAWLTLPRAVAPHGGSVTLSFDWVFTVPHAPADGRQGEDGSAFFLAYWYPQLAVYDDLSGWVTDPYLGTAEFYMGYADYDVRLGVPAGWLVAATGVLQNPDTVLLPFNSSALARLAQARRSDDVIDIVGPGERHPRLRGDPGIAVWHYSATRVRDFAWGTSPDYVWQATRALVGDQHQDTVDIYTFYRPTAAGQAWIHSARYTKNAVAFLSRYLWAYPYPQMTAVEGPIDDGQEFPQLTIITAYADTVIMLGTIMHETAHEWFPMQVGSNETRYVWQDEGLTQFNSAEGQGQVYGIDRFTPIRGDYLRMARAGREIELMRPGNAWVDDEAYHTLPYKKTATALADLRTMVGESLFTRAYREYGRRWQWRHPAPDDFFNTFNDIIDRDLSWFWRTWFYETWPLDRAIGAVRTAGDSVEVEIEDRGLAPMPVRLAIGRADGTVQLVDIPVDVWLNGARRSVVRVAARPRVVRVEIDPGGVFPDVNARHLIWSATP